MTNGKPCHAFVLGCERSGSTWLSNVLDAHPDVEFFMEPFADYANLFSGFPNRNLHVDNQSGGLADVVSEGYGKLRGRKYALFYKPGRHAYWQKFDRSLVATYSRIGKWSTFGPSLACQQFELLNLNRKSVPLAVQNRKNPSPLIQVTKELRLNFKAGLLHKAFPDAKIIIAVRHPGAQVTSIQRLMNKGHLGELQRSLLSLYPSLRASSFFDSYSQHYDCLDQTSFGYEALLLWWLINYQTVISDCQRYGLNHKIVFHEELSDAPLKHFKSICEFLELPYKDEVGAYLDHSTNASAQRDVYEAVSALDTVRDSSAHSRKSIEDISDDVQRSVSKLYECFDVCSELARYNVQGLS